MSLEDQLRAALETYRRALTEQAFMDGEILRAEQDLWRSLSGPNSSIAGVEREIKLQMAEQYSERARIKAEVECARASWETELHVYAAGA